MEDIIGLIILYTFGAVAAVVPLYVIVRSGLNFVRALDGRGTIVLKALVSLIIWGFISLVFVFIPLMYVFEPGTNDPVAASRKITIISLVMTIIYILIGLALSYWVRLQPGWKTQKWAGHST